MRHLTLIGGLAAVLALGLQPAAAQTQPAILVPPAAVPAAPPADTAPTVTLPNGLLSTSATTHLDDGLSGTLVNTTITNKPIPDSPASRRANGGPDSATGRATLPQPGMAATKAHPTPKAYGPQLVPPAGDPPK